MALNSTSVANPPPTTKLNVSLVFSTLEYPLLYSTVAPACMEKFCISFPFSMASTLARSLSLKRAIQASIDWFKAWMVSVR